MDTSCELGWAGQHMAAVNWAETARRLKRPQVEPALEPRALQYAAALYRIRQAHAEHLESAQRRGSQPEFPITPPQLVRLVHFFPLIPPQVKYLNLATFLSRPAFAADYQFLSPLVHCEKPKEAKVAFFAAFPALKVRAPPLLSYSHSPHSPPALPLPPFLLLYSPNRQPSPLPASSSRLFPKSLHLAASPLQKRWLWSARSPKQWTGPWRPATPMVATPVARQV